MVDAEKPTQNGMTEEVPPVVSEKGGDPSAQPVVASSRRPRPQAKSRPGFPPSMPSFEGQLKDREIEGLIAFIKSLK